LFLRFESGLLGEEGSNLGLLEFGVGFVFFLVVFSEFLLVEESFSEVLEEL
jgi:hypothetical protein